MSQVTKSVNKREKDTNLSFSTSGDKKKIMKYKTIMKIVPNNCMS